MHELEVISKTVCIVSPFPPPYGGMAIQAEKLLSLLKENGIRVITVKTNSELPRRIRFVSRVPIARTIANVLVFLEKLSRALPGVSTLYFLTGFFGFFLWVTYPALLLIKAYGKRVILSARGGDARRFFQKYGWLVTPIIKRVDLVTTPSGFLKEVFEDCFNIQGVVIPNIVDLQQFQFRTRSCLRPRLIVTRSLQSIYNVGCAIQAFKEVRGVFPDARLGIVGSGVEFDELRRLTSALGLANAVTFYGQIPHTSIHLLYDAYDIFVNTSNVDNMPGCILEAFASGLPVVSTNAGGIPYLVKHGVTGLLVERNDCHGLAQSVVRLLKDPDLAVRMAARAREECRKYSAEHVKQVLIPLLIE